MEINQLAQLLNETLSFDVNVVRTATDALDRLSLLPNFPFSLLSVATGAEDQGVRIAAATYLKNFTRKNIDDNSSSSIVSKEFKDQLMMALLQAEPAILKVLLESFRVIVAATFVKENSWPELILDLRSAIENSHLISNDANCRWNTVNALMILHAIVRHFQYFSNPKVAKEPVPPQLDLIAQEILVPMLMVFCNLVEKILAAHGGIELETEKILHIMCKCIYFSVRSYMPAALVPHLPSFCHNLIAIMGSINFNTDVTLKDDYLLRLKTGKRSLLIFCAMVTRHRKYSDKLLPDIIKCVLQIVKYGSNVSKLDFPQERIISLAFDVISHVLETGPGWRLVSPHFTFLLDSAIFPTLVLNEKDVSEWEEDADEFMRKNLPSELEEISGWREDLFTARKSAINLLAVISVSKGPPTGISCNGSSKRKKSEKGKKNSLRSSMGELLVLPFLSKFPVPCASDSLDSTILKDYFGVLMAYGGLQDFLKERKPEFTTTLICSRVLPVYTVPISSPYLVATANWVLGELACCLPEDMNADVYSSLLKALALPDKEDTSCYPVRVSAAGGIVALLDNDYLPPQWYPLLQVVVGRIGNEDEEDSILFDLLSSLAGAANENIADHIPYIVSSLVGVISKHLHPSLETWPQVVERGFSALASMAQSWENFMPDEFEQIESSEKWKSSQVAIAKDFSALLQQAWLRPIETMDRKGEAAPPPSCIEDASTLLRSIMLSVSGSNAIVELKLSELLLVWADLIADWHAWEETEDLSVFDCIKEVVTVDSKFGLKNFIARQVPSPPAPPVPQQSVIEGMGAFLSEAILRYPSATWRACTCVHMLLHVPNCSAGIEAVKQSLTVAFCQAAYSRFKTVQSKPCSLWKPLVLAISSCYLCYPEIVEGILGKNEDGGFGTWVSALAFVCSSSFEASLSLESEVKLVVLTVAKVVERLLAFGSAEGKLLRDSYVSLMEASVRLKEVKEKMENDEDSDVEVEEDSDDESKDDDEDSDADDYEETEEEFLERYARAAADLENDLLIEEGDEENQDQEIELGSLQEVDPMNIVASLIEKYYNVIIQGQALPSELVSRYLNAFPLHSLLFQQGK